jgi:predicted translin family RNA/ssDNA-binding protein/energy-coupling factor transporter ATP-binding protein EcfA2
MGGSGSILFGKFDEGEVSEVLRRCAGCGRFVLIGPPRSGKTFLIKNHLRGKLGTSVAIEELIPGITTTAKTEGEEARGEPGLREKVMKYLKGMMPWIKRLRDSAEVDVEELRRVLGDKAPRPVVEGARRRIGGSPHRAYYIPWKCAEEPNACTFDADVSKALGLIKGAFDDRRVRIRWFKAEYIPPGLVEEAIDLIKEGGEGGAREVLGGWVEAYSKADGILRKFLGLGEDLLRWDESSVAFLGNFVNNLASYVIGGLAAIPISAAAVATIAVLTYMAFNKREGENYLREIIELRRSLERLRRPDGEFNELGELLAYTVAYAMGMSYDEAKKALMDITGLSIDELERRVNEIEGRIEKLEKKLELFRQEVPAGIVTADVGEFAKGMIYPNVKVDSGRLRIRVEDRYHNMVKAGKFNELVNEVRGRLTSDGVVVVVGPKGIGKSTLAAAATWELLSNSEVGLVARVDVLNEDNKSRFQTLIENYSEEFVKYFGGLRLLLLYDPVSTESYEEKPGTQPQQGQGESAEAYEEGARYSRIPKDIERTIGNLIKIKRLKTPGDSRQAILIVLPSDIYNAIYNALSEGERNALEKYRLDASQGLINTEFLAELIREYTKTEDNPNGCALSNDVLNELADKVAKFDSGHALIARLVGEELARSNCGVGRVEELISEARSKAEAFIILHINGLFKVHENPNTAKALVEAFALRRPFVNEARPGDPILTPGVVKLIGEKRGAETLYSAEGGELRGWLAHRQHDLIEGSIGELLNCIANGGEECEKKLGGALRPWRLITVSESLKKVLEMGDVDSAVKYFVDNYGEEFTGALRYFSKCWRRAAFIIGLALAGHDSVPRPEDLGEDVAKSLGDALRGCGVDDYLLVGNEIPQLIQHLTYTRVLTEAFIDRYGEAVAEVNRVLNIARGRGGIRAAEEFYGLGLASIIANAAGLGKVVEPSDADAALYIASFTIQSVASSNLIRPVLGALEPLRGKAPHRYIELLYSASDIGYLDRDTARYILDELNKVLDNYGDRFKGHAWLLVHAISAYAHLIENHSFNFDDEEVKGMVGRVADLLKLNELGRFKSSLGVIAWAQALIPALDSEDVRGLMEEKLGIDVFNRANEVLGELNELREKVQELMRNEGFMNYVESRSIKADEEAVRGTILEMASRLKNYLAIYMFNNDELDEAARLFNEAAKEYREIGEYGNYLVVRSWALRAEAIEGSLVGNKLVDEFRQLYEETFNEEHFELTVPYISNASVTLGEYLVSLALTGGDEGVKKIKELLEEHRRVLNAYYEGSVLTRLTLNALLGPRGELSGELKGRLVVEPGELIKAFKDKIHREFLPALMVTFGLVKPEDVGEACESIDEKYEKGKSICEDATLAVKGNGAAVEVLREEVLIKTFRERISKEEKLNLLKELGFDAKSLSDEFRGLVEGLDGKSLVQLLALKNSRVQLAFMLYALINGDEKLAKAHALYGTAAPSDKLPARLYLDVYRACEKGCDLGNEGLRQAITKLFLYHF